MRILSIQFALSIFLASGAVMACAGAVPHVGLPAIGSVRLEHARATPVHPSDRLAHLPLLDVRQFGALGDGLTDDYEAISAAVAYMNSIGSGTLVFPPGVYRIDRYIGDARTPATTAIEFQNCHDFAVQGFGATIEVKGDFHKTADVPLGDIEGDGVPRYKSLRRAITPFVFRNCQRFELQGFTVNGNVDKMTRDLNVYQGPGEGVATYGCADYALEDLYVHHMSEDGIYIGGLARKPAIGEAAKADRNVSILRVVSANNTRQGLSVIHARGLIATDSVFVNSGLNDASGSAIGPYGVDPPTNGVDIEPDYPALPTPIQTGVTYGEGEYVAPPTSNGHIYRVRSGGSLDSSPSTQWSTKGATFPVGSLTLADAGTTYMDVQAGQQTFENCTFAGSVGEEFSSTQFARTDTILIRNCNFYREAHDGSSAARLAVPNTTVEGSRFVGGRLLLTGNSVSNTSATAIGNTFLTSGVGVYVHPESTGDVVVQGNLLVCTRSEPGCNLLCEVHSSSAHFTNNTLFLPKATLADSEETQAVYFAEASQIQDNTYVTDAPASNRAFTVFYDTGAARPTHEFAAHGSAFELIGPRAPVAEEPPTTLAPPSLASASRLADRTQVTGSIDHGHDGLSLEFFSRPPGSDISDADDYKFVAEVPVGASSSFALDLPPLDIGTELSAVAVRRLDGAILDGTALSNTIHVTEGTAPADPPLTLGLIDPGTSLTLFGGSHIEVRWSVEPSAYVQAQRVELSRDGGLLWEAVSGDLDASIRQWDWLVPIVDPSEGRLRVTAVDLQNRQWSSPDSVDFAIQTVSPWTVSDAAAALRLSAGIQPVSPDDMRRLNVLDSADTIGRITLLDVLVILRAAFGWRS
ncbi:MAG TPA: glycosyl hydrolase family 28-related protein [Armatimonadota bacterium]|jgi:hypothetical protein